MAIPNKAKAPFWHNRRYTVFVLVPGRKLPVCQELSDRAAGRNWKMDVLRSEHPEGSIQARLNYGFVHGRPMRWYWDDTQEKPRAVPMAYYNQFESGSRVPTARAADAAKGRLGPEFGF